MGVFQGRTKGFGWLDAGSHASFSSSSLNRFGPRYCNFSHFCMTCSLEKLRLLDQNWLEGNLSALLLRALVVGRRQQSESIGVYLDNTE